MEHGQIQDYPCTYDAESFLEGEESESTNSSALFPSDPFSCEEILACAGKRRENRKSEFFTLPFCHTIEAEALGAKVNYGDSEKGPRICEYAYSDFSGLLTLPQMNLEKGRISGILDCCSRLSEKDETVLLEITGPFTVLCGLIDLKDCIKVWRRNPELFYQVLESIGDRLLAYYKEAACRGVRYFSYADSNAGISILGPKRTEELTVRFTAPYLKRILQVIGEDSLCILCPKTAFALTGSGAAECRKHIISEKVLTERNSMLSYEKACILLRGKIHMTGQICINKGTESLKDGIIQEIEML